MTKKKLNENWITQKELAKEKGVEIGCVSNWVIRGRVDSMEVYGKVLVNRNTITARKYTKSK